MLKIKLKGIDRIVKKTEKLINNYDLCCKTFLQKLADIGYETASIKFSTAQYDGVNDVIVDKPKWINDNTIVITANGKAVAFIEFGTGITYSSTRHPLGDEKGAIIGGYGQGKGKQTSWGYYGEAGTNGKIIGSRGGKDIVITKGNPPAMAMYQASQDMKNELLKIAKEVFL